MVTYKVSKNLRKNKNIRTHMYINALQKYFYFAILKHISSICIFVIVQLCTVDIYFLRFNIYSIKHNILSLIIS